VARESARAAGTPSRLPDIGLGERGRVVDAVADEGDGPVFDLQLPDGRHLAVRHDLGDDVVYAELSGDGVGRAPAVASHHRDLQAKRMQRRHDLRRGFLYRVRDGHHGGDPAADGDEERRLSFLAQSVRSCDFGQVEERLENIKPELVPSTAWRHFQR